MAKRRDWDRVRVENRIRRYGTEPLAADPLHPRIRPDAGLGDADADAPRVVTRPKVTRPGMVRCPECDAELNLTNMRRHFARVHPRRTLPADRNGGAGGLRATLQPAPPAEPAPAAPLTAEIRTSRQLAEELTKGGYIAAFLLREAQELGATATSVDTALTGVIVRRIRARFMQMQQPGEGR